MSLCHRCGAPTVWSESNRRRWCAIYGDHKPAPIYLDEPDVLFVRRNMDAPLAHVVDELAAMPMPAGIRRTRKADYQTT